MTTVETEPPDIDRSPRFSNVANAWPRLIDLLTVTAVIETTMYHNVDIKAIFSVPRVPRWYANVTTPCARWRSMRETIQVGRLIDPLCFVGLVAPWPIAGWATVAKGPCPHQLNAPVSRRSGTWIPTMGRHGSCARASSAANCRQMQQSNATCGFMSRNTIDLMASHVVCRQI